MTPRTLLFRTAERFRAAEIPDPMTDAAALLSHLTGRQPLALRLDTDTELDTALTERYEALCRERLKRVPLQYLTGEVVFLGHVFHADARALIPRPETELLAELAVERLADTERPRVLDLCCGTGCIGLSIALARPDAAVTLADLSPDALALARENAERLSAPAVLRQGDLFAAAGGERFDLIVSNPPYIPREDCGKLQPEVLREPRMALDGGGDGLDFYRRIIREAPAHLTPDGRLLLELGDGEAERVAALLTDGGWRDIAVRRDYAGLPRMAEAVRPFACKENP